MFSGDFTSIEKKALLKSNAIILRADLEGNLQQYLKELRKDIPNPLIPVIIITDTDSELINELADFVVKPFSINENIIQIERVINEINEQFDEFGRVEKLTASERDMINVLRFMISRKKDLKPIPDWKSNSCYSYPFIETIIENGIFSMLDNLEQYGFLRPNFIDRIHLCPKCGSGHINFREACPSTGSPNIRAEDNIHHFNCGYVGPQSDFEVPGSDKLMCPKDHVELRHIGVDYDKPSQSIICNDSGEIFQEAIVNCLCLDCREVFLPEDAPKREILSYSITNIGVDTGKIGSLTYYTIEKILKTSIGTKAFNYFEMMLEAEKKRSERYKNKSTVLFMKYKKLDELKEEIGVSNAFEFLRDITLIIKEEIRETDEVSSLGENKIAVLFTDTPGKDIKKIVMPRINRKIETQVAIKKFKMQTQVFFDLKLLELPDDNDNLAGAIKWFKED